MKNSRQEALENINSAPKSHFELCKIAKKALQNRPKEKYKMKVYRQISGKEFAELRASTKAKLKKSTLTFGNAYPDSTFTYGEIEPIK